MVTPHFDKVICNDINEYLIALFNGVQAGYILPDAISEEQYKYVKEHKDEDKTLDCDKCKDISVSRSQLYKQIGNGICVNCVELLFEHLYKSQYDPNFVCYDEVMATNQSNGGD